MWEKFQLKMKKGLQMSNLQILHNGGMMMSVDENAIKKLQDSMQGPLMQAGHEQYDDARTIWNAMIDRKPALIARCLNASDVQHAVKFASEHALLTAVKGGGHNIAGNAVCNDGFMIDLSQMNSVTVDTSSKTVKVGPGATLGDLDGETLPHGLAVPVGINSTTGIAGLTLGGGFGWLSRKYGLTIDSLVDVEIVTSDGNLIHANKDEHADLFWAVRGGGGNFGVITQFKFQLRKAGPETLNGLIVFPIAEATSAMKKYREFAKTLSNETTVWVVLRKAPPLPFLPEDVHGKEVIVFAFCHIGDVETGQKAIEPIRSFGTSVGEMVGVMPFANWQQAFDPLLTPGARNYWKSHNFMNISDELIDVTVKYVNTIPNPGCEIFFAQLGGETSKLPADSTAYPHRDANYTMNVHGRWDDASEDDKCIKWSREFFKETEPFATGGVYINFMTEEETDRVGNAFGASYEKLAQVKQKYDANNLFRLNQNVKPTR